jgi:hypothetical protein
MATDIIERPGTAASKSIEKSNGDMAPRKRHEELQYLDLVQEILANGEHRPDRYEWTLIRNNPPLSGSPTYLSRIGF